MIHTQVIVDYLNEESQKGGYGDYVEAYHVDHDFDDAPALGNVLDFDKVS